MPLAAIEFRHCFLLSFLVISPAQEDEDGEDFVKEGTSKP
jgi:hypothetical protein